MLLIVGAWSAWRRSPMYSRRSTLHAAFIILLAVAGGVGLIVATVQLTINRSPVVAGSAMAVAIVVSTLSMIFFIQAATVPKESKPAALPHSAKLVNVNRWKVFKWAKVFAVLLAFFGLGGLLPGAAAIVSLTLGGLTLLLAAILLPVYYVTTRGLDQSLTAVELDPWVHWQYTPEQWRQWCGLQAERLRATPPTFTLARDWHRFIFPFVIIIGGVAVFGPGTWVFKVGYLGLVCGAILVVAVMSGRGGAAQADKLQARLLAAAPEAYFGRDGLFADGVFTPWLNVSTNLVSAGIDERQPRSLLFNFERIVPNPYGPAQVVPIHHAVPVPAGAEGDVARLQAELNARCPKAQIALA
jgi:hypothetical protein